MLTKKAVVTRSGLAVRRETLSETAWQSIREPGAYVDRETGDLYRFGKEALAHDAMPSVVKESRDASALVKLSDNPFIATFWARVRTVQHNIQPNF